MSDLAQIEREAKGLGLRAVMRPIQRLDGTRRYDIATGVEGDRKGFSNLAGWRAYCARHGLNPVKG